MAVESGIDKTVAEKEGVEGTAAEETPEAMREQIKKLKGDVKLFKYASFIGIPSLYVSFGISLVFHITEIPTRVYSISNTQYGEVYDGAGDLDGDGISDLVLERRDRSLIPFFGHKFDGEAITYVQYEEMEKLNPNSTVDYKCINDKLMEHSEIIFWSDKQLAELYKKRKTLKEYYGFNPIGINCTKGSNSNK